LHLLLPHPQAGADGEKGRLNYPRRMFERPLSQPHSLADAATLRSKLAKASLRGERQSEGGLLQAFFPAKQSRGKAHALLFWIATTAKATSR
jgi:hypothetical protein